MTVAAGEDTGTMTSMLAAVGGGDPIGAEGAVETEASVDTERADADEPVDAEHPGEGVVALAAR